jgi:hypothetical protein
MRALFLCFLLLAFALVAEAQTRTDLGQIKGPATTSVQVLALVNGRLVLVSIGAGVSLVQVGSAWELRATGVAGVDVKLSRAADGNWTLPNGCSLRSVYRNGLLQLRGVDYTASTTAVRFSDGAGGDPSLADDTVVATCQ